MSGKRVLSVGQCGADHGSLSHVLRRHFDVEVVPADTAAEALELLRAESFALVLVNRVLDLDHTSGVDLVRRIKTELANQTIMLVSNYDDAQDEAVRAGATRGFGKAALGHPQTLGRLKAVLGDA
jgi:two-component system chemotaxis response regulator CheY